MPIEQRNVVVYTVLAFMTCGLWAIIWFFQIGSDIQRATGSDKPNAGLDFVLSILTCGIWSIVVAIQWPNYINDARRSKGMSPVQDIQALSIVLAIFTGVFLYTYWQIQLNKIAQGYD
jgi:hypothetical protein